MDLNKKTNQWLVLLIMSFIWGTSFILIKKSLLAYSPAQSGALRISFAFLYFLPVAIIRIKKLKRKNLKYLLIAGFIGNFFPAFMFAFGQTVVSSSISSVLNSTTPIFVLLTGLLFFKTKISLINILGVIIGFIGTIGLISNGNILLFSSWNLGVFVILGATLLYGINTNILKFKFENLDGLSISAFSFLFIGPWAIAYFIGSDLHAAFQNTDFWVSTISLATLAFFSSFIALILFVTLIKYTTPIFTASTTYIIPVFAVLWGILDGETISLFQIFSIIIIFIAVSLVNKKSSAISLVPYRKK